MYNERTQQSGISENNLSEKREEFRDSLAGLIAKKNDPDLMKKYQEKLIEIQAVLRENARLQETVREQKKILYELSYDSVTDLKIRSLFFKQLHHDVTSILSEIYKEDVLQWENLPLKEFTEKINHLDISAIEDRAPAILMGDVAYLSLANTTNHTIGDNLLRNIGTAGKNTAEIFSSSAEFFRYGGDEIVGILHTNNEQTIKEIAHTFESEVAKTPFSHLESFGIPPHLHIDIGTSRFLEGFTAFRDLLITMQAENSDREKQKNEYMDIPYNDRFKFFLDMWVTIVDEKSILRKAERRLPTLTFYKENMPEVYAGIIGSMRKGALNVTDAEIDALKGSDSLTMRQFIVARRLHTKEEGEKISSRRSALVSNIVHRIATKEFLAE